MREKFQKNECWGKTKYKKEMEIGKRFLVIELDHQLTNYIFAPVSD